VTTDQLRLSRSPEGWTQRLPSGSGAALLAVPAAAGLGVAAVLQPQLWRGLLAAALVVNVVVLGMKWPKAAAVATLLWLPLLALVRRLLIGEAGWTQNDPLLLVGPIAALFLCCRIFVLERRQIAPDRISKLVLLLLVIAFAGAFNPVGEGGLFGGLAGLMYLGVPLLWFFIGRELGDRQTVRRLMQVVVVLAVAIAAYGLYQTEFGSFPQWDIDWFHVSGFAALGVGTSESGSLLLRPWGTFASNSEYSAWLGIAVVFAVAMLYHRRPVLAVTVPMLMIALFLAGGRSVMALTLIGFIVLTALRSRNKALALVVVVLGIGATYGAALAFGERVDRAAGLSGDAKAERQAGGLLNPLDPDESTFITHWEAFLDGIGEGFAHPVGLGTGASNLGGKVGGEGERGSGEQAGGGREGDLGGSNDNDVADVFISLGLAGGFVFLAIIVLSFRTVFSRYWRGQTDWAMLAVAGTMVVTLGYWLKGGHYATSALLWFLLGWAVKPTGRTLEREARAREVPLHQRLRRLTPWRGEDGGSDRSKPSRSRSGSHSRPGSRPKSRPREPAAR